MRWKRKKEKIYRGGAKAAKGRGGKRGLRKMLNC